MLIDLHVHTRRYSACGHADPEEMAAAAEAYGLDAMVITEHHVRWSEDELVDLQGAFPRVRLFAGVEITTERSGDLLVIGASGRDWFRPRMPAEDVVAEAHARGGVVIAAHPFRPGYPGYGLDRLDEFTDRVDVMILCGGSKDDLPVQGPETAARFNIVDSFDTHARIPEYFEQVDRAARPAGHTALISTGWDPGVFSINRLFGEAILPEGETHTFWGDGVSQGHSDAVRRVEGVSDAVQYTLPSAAAVERVRNGDGAGLGLGDRHLSRVDDLGVGCIRHEHRCDPSPPSPARAGAPTRA